MGCTLVGKASSSEQACEMIIESKPDLILMDIKINGDMDGIDIMKETGANSRVIYLTGNSDAITKKRADETNPDGYLIKPVDMKVLHNTIKAACDKIRS